MIPLERRAMLADPARQEYQAEGLYEDEGSRMRCVWDRLPHLQETFRYFYQSSDNQERGGKGQRLADYITTMLRELRALG